MALRLRFLRGVLLRVAMRRPVAAVAGIALLAPAIVLMRGNYAWESGMTDGVGLILGATGAALVFTALTGRQPDWIDPDRDR